MNLMYLMFCGLVKSVLPILVLSLQYPYFPLDAGISFIGVRVVTGTVSLTARFVK